jgi:predicted transcriptional regulator
LEIFDDAQATYEPSTETLEQCIDIFSTFANLDTIRIFLLAEKGISNSNKAIKKLDLTPKRYYSRLKALVDSGVLEKVNGIYTYTPVGEMLHSLGLSLINLVDNKQKIGLLMNLSKSDALSDEEHQKINSMIVGNTDVGKMLGSMISGVPQEKTVKISEYKTLVESLAREIASSKKSMLIASRYFDVWVIDECLKARDRGVDMRVLMSKETMSKKVNKLRMMLSPKLLMKILELSEVTDIKEILRETDLAFSFCIIDSYKCFFEFPSVGGEFSIAFMLENEKTSLKFTKFFNSIWESLNPKKPSDFVKRISE